jgi:hypothetical protein
VWVSWGQIDLPNLRGGTAAMCAIADYRFALASPVSVSDLLRKLLNERPYEFPMGAGDKAFALFAGKLRAS